MAATNCSRNEEYDGDEGRRQHHYPPAEKLPDLRKLAVAIKTEAQEARDLVVRVSTNHCALLEENLSAPSPPPR